MEIKVELYESPRLVDDVQNGEIIEAQKLSFATRGKNYGIDYFPTGVFGYVRGMLVSNTKCRALSEGTTVVERITPLDLFTPEVELTLNEPLHYFRDNGPYFVHGKITSHDRSNDGELPALLEQDSVSLWKEDKKDLRLLVLRNIVNRRQGKNYVFRTPDEKTYNMCQIIAGLMEKQ